MKIGYNTKIHSSVEFVGEFNSFEIGDNVEIGEGVKILGGGDLFIGDYSKINRNCFINASGVVRLGQATWVGERVVLDGTGKLWAGDFLGVGIGSGLYSHIRHGDVTEGCLYEKESELIIGDDVWFVGECFVSPIIAKDKSMAMLGSVVVKNMDENSVYGGNPAVNITHKTGVPWIPKTESEKFLRVARLIEEGCNKFNLDKDMFKVVYSMPEIKESGITYYNILDRTYRKTNSDGEIKMNKWLFNARAKFRKS